MAKIIVVVLALAVCVALIIIFNQEVTAETTYKPIVIEYNPHPYTNSNVRRYEDLIRLAARNHSADIVVFPEGTLSVDKDSVSLVPPAGDNVKPYKNHTYAEYEVITAMSKAAAENSIYVVVNLREVAYCNKSEKCPPSGYHIYNTNVVFDRKGTVVARYRKVNLFDEPGIDRPEPEAVSFTTDFGVTFGTFTCFDILFQTPAMDLVHEMNIKDFIFPTYWFSELPFLTAVQAQFGWSYVNNVNLLASGANRPSRGSGGSGIYHGRTKKNSFMSERSGTVLMTDDEMILDEDGSSSDGLKFLEDPSIPSATHKPLDVKSGAFRETVCSHALCCRFNVSYRPSQTLNPRVTYTALAFDDERSFGDSYRGKAHYCAVVACTDGNCAGKPENGDLPLVFDEARIEAEFEVGDAFQMPTTLVWKVQHDGVTLFDTMDYNDFEYKSEDAGGKRKVMMRTKSEMSNIITFGIFGRRFD